MMYFRCVHDDQRSFALGIQWIKVRIFGTIPAPLIFGFLIDDSCILWQESCDDAGACLVYDNYSMSRLVIDYRTFHIGQWAYYIKYFCFAYRYMLSLALIGKACSVMFFFGAWWCYVPPKQTKADEKCLQTAKDGTSSYSQSESSGRF